MSAQATYRMQDMPTMRGFMLGGPARDKGLRLVAGALDDMICRRAPRLGHDMPDEGAERVVSCALKGLDVPAGTLPAPATESADPLLQPWLLARHVRMGAYDVAAKAYGARRAECLGSVDPLDRLKAMDAVRRSLVVAVARNNQDVARRAMRLLNDLGARDERGRQLLWEDCRSLDVLDAALERKVRPLEYWLAVHHFERRWICGMRRYALARTGCGRVA